MIMATEKGRSPRLPTRPWSLPDVPRQRTPRDWAAELTRDFQQPGLAHVVPEASSDGPSIGGVESFQARLAAGRQAALDAARLARSG